MKNNRVAALRHLHDKLKSGEYDGTDVMAAWIAVEDLACLLERAENEPCPGEHEDPDFKREDGSCTICSPQPPFVKRRPYLEESDAWTSAEDERDWWRNYALQIEGACLRLTKGVGQ